MTTRIRKTLAVLVAITVLASGAGAAAIAWDTETTNTATTSDISGATTTVTFHPTDNTKTIYAEVSGASTANLTLELSPATAGVDHVAYSNATPDTEDATNGHYSFTISHDELAEVPRESTGATYNVSIINEDTDAEVLTTEIVLNSDGVNEQRAIISVADDSADGDASALTPLVADRLDLETESAGWANTLNVFSDANDTDVATWSGYTTVNGTNSTVTVKMDNSTAASAYDAAAEDRDDGEALKLSTVSINGIPHLVYNDEEPEDYPTDATLVTYDDTNDELTIELGDEYENVSTVNVRSTGGAGYSFSEAWSNFGLKKAVQVAL